MNKKRKEYMTKKVNKWVIKLKLLSEIANFSLQAAYWAFTSGFRQKFNYIIQTIYNISHILQQTKNVIQQEFITLLFEGRTCNDEGLLLYLPGRLGRMDINILSIPDIEYQSSKTTLKK